MIIDKKIFGCRDAIKNRIAFHLPLVLCTISNLAEVEWLKNENQMNESDANGLSQEFHTITRLFYIESIE